MYRKILLTLLYLYAMVFSILKTVRFPNGWSGGHWMLDYRFGFIKRGLGGEIFGWFFDKNEHSVFILSLVILIALHIVIFWIVLKEIFKHQYSFYRILFYLIFLLSQYIVFATHTIGYLDNFVFLITILVILMMKQKKVFLSSLIATFCILFHEMSFLLLLPVSCFALIVTEYRNEKFVFKYIFSRNIFKKLITFLLLPILMMITISIYQEMNGGNYYSKIVDYLVQFSFIDRYTAGSVASAYTKSFSYYFSTESGHFLQRLFVSTCTIFNGLPMLFLLWMIFKEFHLKHNLHLVLLLIFVSFLPLIMHIIAYDVYRIWTYPYMIIFLIFWVLSSKYKLQPKEIEKLSNIEIAFFLLAFLLVSLIPTPLFDNQVERFSLLTRIIMILPIFILLYLIKKSQPKITETFQN